MNVMNRLLVAALTACLAQAALACSVERTEIYEPAPAPAEQSETIDKYQVSDDTPIAYPVPTDVAEPFNPDLAKVTDDHRNLLNPDVKYTGVPAGIDIAVLPPLPNVDGVIIPTQDLDHNQVVTQPALGVSPFLVIDPPPTRGNASAVKNPF